MLREVQAHHGSHGLMQASGPRMLTPVEVSATGAVAASAWEPAWASVSGSHPETGWGPLSGWASAWAWEPALASA
jgi:hypothetical protein